jgi:hypothetical protein
MNPLGFSLICNVELIGQSKMTDEGWFWSSKRGTHCLLTAKFSFCLLVGNHDKMLTWICNGQNAPKYVFMVVFHIIFHATPQDMYHK